MGLIKLNSSKQKFEVKSDLWKTPNTIYFVNLWVLLLLGRRLLCS